MWYNLWVQSLQFGSCQAFNFERYHSHSIYNSDLKEKIGLIEMFNKTNLFALVGLNEQGQKMNKYRVTFWDDFHEKIIGEITYKRKVRLIRVRQNR